MNYWQQREADLLKQENAWLDELGPFMRLIDSHWGFVAFWSLLASAGFVIGAAIGFLL
jgi:hypothetical protein